MQATLLGIAALLSALGGILSTVWAIRKGRKEERESLTETYRERLAASREESEKLAKELHDLRMRRIEEGDNGGHEAE